MLTKLAVFESFRPFGLFPLTIIMALPGCGHLSTERNPKSYAENFIEKNSNENANLEYKSTKIENARFDIPIEINSRVETWLDYFTGRGRPVFERHLERGDHFIPYITSILRDHGMPADLVYLAMIESGFNNHARSKARAVGPWQFISPTGKRYGLEVSWWVDERRNIRKSTEAAIRYLNDLHKMTGKWELAAASYNAGEGKIKRAVRRYRTSDFWTIAKHQFLRPETRNYVPKWYAAAILGKNREQFGFKKAVPYAPIEENLIAGANGVFEEESGSPGLLEILDGDVAEGATEQIASIAKPETSESIERVLAGNDSGGDSWLSPFVSRNGEVQSTEVTEFEIRGPADLRKVAYAAGVSYLEVKRLNPEYLRWCTPPATASSRVKLPTSKRDRFLTVYNHPTFSRSVDYQVYRVRKGDSLNRIVRRFGYGRVSINSLKELNQLKNNTDLRAGRKILLPIPAVNDPTKKPGVLFGRLD